MKMIGPAFLAFQGRVYSVDASKHSSSGGRVAAECICARLVRAAAVWALRAEAQAEDVSQSKTHQDLEAVGAGKRVPRKQRPSRFVAWQFLG